MSETGSNAQFSGTQKGITTIGNHLYGYSGETGVINAQTTMNSFNTGKYYSVVQWTCGYASESGDNMQFRIKFNGIVVYKVTLDSRLVGSPYQWIPLIIPPFTTVLVTCENKSGSTEIFMISNWTGRVMNK